MNDELNQVLVLTPAEIKDMLTVFDRECRGPEFRIIKALFEQKLGEANAKRAEHMHAMKARAARAVPKEAEVIATMTADELAAKAEAAA